MLEKAHFFLSLMIFNLCFWGGLTLLLHPRRNKAKHILGLSMLFWALLIGVHLTINPFSGQPQTILHPIVLITGSFVIATTTCYVIEILRPGYLTCKRFLIFISPAFVCILIFCIYCLFNAKYSNLLFNNTLLTSPEIDITIKYILLLVNIMYMIIPIYLTICYKKEYTHFLIENVSNPEDYDLNWLNRTIIVLTAMYMFYFILLLTYNKLLYIIDKSCILILWYYFFYKALFLKEIPWQHSFISGWEIPIPQEKKSQAKDNYCNPSKATYIQEINQWFEMEKPYLCGTLNLADVQRKFPISRTYLSQLFNKELGTSFSDYVNNFRIEESKFLLENEPNTDITEIAIRSGFNAISTFRRAFTKQTNLSPSEYKRKCKKAQNTKKTE